MRNIITTTLLLLALSIMPVSARNHHDRGHRGDGCRTERPGRAHEGYYIGSHEVFYDGKPVKNASAMSFKVLSDGYARDPWRVFYRGKQVKDASATSFKVLRDGYARDPWRVFYRGKQVKDASSTTFKVLSDGYAKDAWRTLLPRAPHRLNSTPAHNETGAGKIRPRFHLWV